MKITFEDIKRIIRRRTAVQTIQWKKRQKDKRTKNDLQNTTQKTKN